MTRNVALGLSLYFSSASVSSIFMMLYIHVFV